MRRWSKRKLIGVNNFCKNNQCSKCGECCSPNIPITKKELCDVANYLDKNPIIKYQAYNNKPIKGNDVYLKCCFYMNNKCLIYPVRPLICRQFQCNQDEKTMILNRENAHKRADYNRVDNLSTVTDFRELLFGDPTTVVYSIAHIIGTVDIEKVKNLLIKIGRSDLAIRLKEGDVKR